MRGSPGWRGSALILLLAAPLPARAGDGLADLDEAALDLRAEVDAAELLRYARVADELTKTLAQHASLFRREATESLSADEKALALDLFEQVLAYQVALDSLARFHFDFYRIPVIGQATRHARHFLLGFTAYLEQVRLGTELIQRTVGQAQFEKLLDEGSPERGLPPGAYAKLKWNVVHVEEVGRLFAAAAYHKALRATLYKKLPAGPLKELGPVADRELSRVARTLKSGGPKLFSENGLDILKDGGHQAWFPVQAGVAEWMGDQRVRRVSKDLISAEQIVAATAKSQPGDVILERRNWYLSNVGLPGFWPHVAFYLGSPAELSAAFDADPEVSASFKGPFSAALAKKHPRAWAEYQKGEHEHPFRLIEAMSEGVVFTTAEHSYSADYVGALRPRLSKAELAVAIDRAFGYFGRPYDFDFDFSTDRTLVCSELVYKSFEPTKGYRGLRLPLLRVVGRPTLPPTAIVALFDQALGSPEAIFDFAWFLDGREKEGRASFADGEVFRATHRRPKWDISQQ